MAMVQPKYVEQPRISNPRRARAATRTRKVKSHRARYESLVRVGVVLGIVLIGLMSYVMLVSNITSTTYALEKAQHKRELLQEETARLDERLATMRSNDRLAAIASKLQMKEPQLFAVIQLAPTEAAKSKYPVFDSIASLFGASAPVAR